MAGMTTRERRLARAERLEEWADKREAKQAALSEAARTDEGATGIPFGQPILVGHHSEGRHRAAIKRMDSAMRASAENSQKAASMATSAESIRKQADGAIYDDDPDAIEALTAKIERLEAQRDGWKARNAEYRREHKAELKGLGAWEKSQKLPIPSYAITNQTANIGRLRKRLEGLKRNGPKQARDRMILARFAGSCEDCGAGIEQGQMIRYSRAAGARCEKCDEGS